MIYLCMFLIIFFLAILFYFLFLLSNIEIEIKEFKYNSLNKKKKLEDYLVYIKIKLFDKFTWIKIKIDKDKVKKIKESKLFRSELLKKVKMNDKLKTYLTKNKKNILKNINIGKLDTKFKMLNLYMDISLIDNIATVFSVASVSSLISILLAKTSKGVDVCNYYYKICPIYKQKIYVKVSLNCIIDLKIVHIINVLNIKRNKRRVKRNERRTSNRRPYVFCND